MRDGQHLVNFLKITRQEALPSGLFQSKLEPLRLMRSLVGRLRNWFPGLLADWLADWLAGQKVWRPVAACGNRLGCPKKPLQAGWLTGWLARKFGACGNPTKPLQAGWLA